MSRRHGKCGGSETRRNGFWRLREIDVLSRPTGLWPGGSHPFTEFTLFTFFIAYYVKNTMRQDRGARRRSVRCRPIWAAHSRPSTWQQPGLTFGNGCESRPVKASQTEILIRTSEWGICDPSGVVGYYSNVFPGVSLSLNPRLISGIPPGCAPGRCGTRDLSVRSRAVDMPSTRNTRGRHHENQSQSKLIKANQTQKQTGELRICDPSEVVEYYSNVFPGVSLPLNPRLISGIPPGCAPRGRGTGVSSVRSIHMDACGSRNTRAGRPCHYGGARGATRPTSHRTNLGLW
jgi:hypothetical protein